MSMSAGGSHMKAEMNVTPMIDVLLVLLVIFMIVAPQLSTGLETQVPQNSEEKSAGPAEDIVLTVVGDGTVRLNQETVVLADLQERLQRLFKNAAHHVIFVRGEAGLDFQQVADVIDIAKGAGLDRVALMTR